ncbi:GNAT family N-acetyltransferase [Methyloversatilis discipulorum]|uniref:GNAT family N-acetyltransferase n=1 Tax=Methyloversatilis discipulorum TaxID=1119528 RepID=UPI001A3CE6C9|nr:GNAT family N-acetyltransferase [Methyloversatilis discipulorum]MBL8469392.1 GNAT family N-acetyltransferase [Methyloversatilis discipulorum]
MTGSLTVDPADIGSSPWEMFQDAGFMEICSRHYRWRSAEWSGVRGVARNLPLLGDLRARVFGPEARVGAQWSDALAAARAGCIDVMTNLSVRHPLFECISPPDLVSMLVDLRGDRDVLFSRFEGRARKAVRRAQREGLVVERLENSSELDELHALLMRLTGGGQLYEVPPLPLMHMLRDAGYARIYLARWRSEVVGGIYVVGARIAHGYVSGFDASACGGLPGSLLYWETMAAEADAGREWFDLGAQSPAAQPGLALAKRAYGPVHLPAFRYIVRPRGLRPALARRLLSLRGSEPRR